MTLVQQLGSSTATDIHNAAHAVVTAVAVGTTVHDFVTVTGQPGKSDPDRERDDRLVPERRPARAPRRRLGGTFALERERAGRRDRLRLHGQHGRAACVPRALPGRSRPYTRFDGPCEPLQVVDANIQITPERREPGRSNHTFTAHVNVNDGTGFVNAPDGTPISFTIDSGPGGFTTPNRARPAGGTGSCTITYTRR